MFSTSFLIPSNAQMPARPPVAPPAAANQTSSPAPSNSGCSSNLDGCSNEGADCFINGQKGACKTTVVGGFPYGCQCSLPLPPLPCTYSGNLQCSGSCTEEGKVCKLIPGSYPSCACGFPDRPIQPNNEEQKTCEALGCSFLPTGSSCEESEYQITAITSGVCCCPSPATPTNQPPALDLNEAPPAF